MFTYKLSISYKKYVLGAILGLLTGILGVAAFQTYKHAGLNWFKVSPTWQYMADLAGKGQLTSQVMESYIRNRIDERIAYWKAEYAAWQKRWNKDCTQDVITGQAYQELSEIPLYIILKPDVNSHDFTQKIFVYSDKEAQEFYNDVKKQYADPTIWETQGFFDITQDVKSMYIKDFLDGSVRKHFVEFFPYDLLFTIEHEMTHCEQSLNGECIECMLAYPVREYLLMTHKQAHEAYQKVRNDKNYKVSKSATHLLETEADMNALKFHPNVYGFYQLCQKQVDLNWPDNGSDYLSRAQAMKVAQDYIQQRPHDKNKCIQYAEHEITKLKEGHKQASERRGGQKTS